MSETREEAEEAIAIFEETYKKKYPKAVESIKLNEEYLLTFFNFPGEHWLHIRTSNVLESLFSTVRLRTNKTRGMCSAQSIQTLVFKLIECATKKMRRINGAERLLELRKGVKFIDGIPDKRKK
jgi:transposase-like protein